MANSEEVGRTRHAGYQVGVRKTFNIGVQDCWRLLFSEKGLSKWLGKVSMEDFQLQKEFGTQEGIVGKITVLKPDSHIRLTWKPKHWTNISHLQMRVIANNGRATISFHQDKLKDRKQREAMKKYWDHVLRKIEDEIRVMVPTQYLIQ